MTGNKKDELFQIYINKIHNPWMQIMQKLNEKHMKVSDVIEILNIKSRQLFYWYLKQAKIQHRKNYLKGERSWNRFSTIDLLSFALMISVRKFNVLSDNLTYVVAWLKSNIGKTPFCLYNYTLGYDFYLYINLNLNALIPIYERRWGLPHDGLHRMRSPMVVIPIFPILDKILNRIEVDNLSVVSEGRKMTFNIDNEPIDFKVTQNEFDLILNRYAPGMSTIMLIDDAQSQDLSTRANVLSEAFPDMVITLLDKRGMK